jgi:hypothetical protein
LFQFREKDSLRFNSSEAIWDQAACSAGGKFSLRGELPLPRYFSAIVTTHQMLLFCIERQSLLQRCYGLAAGRKRRSTESNVRLNATWFSVPTVRWMSEVLAVNSLPGRA